MIKTKHNDSNAYAAHCYSTSSYSYELNDRSILEWGGCNSMSDTDPEYELVNHPDHYNAHPSGVECIDIIEHMSFNVGAAMKHIWRLGTKPGVDADQDLKKAIWYLERERQRLQKIG